MATIPDLISRARLELSDQPTPWQAAQIADGLTTQWDLPVRALVPGTTAASIDGVPTTVTTQDTSGILQFGTPPSPAGAQITASGQRYRYFSDDEWTTFVTTALQEHIYHKQGTDLGNLPLEEEYPVSLYAVVQALYVLVNDSAMDIDVSTPEGVSIPRHQRYEQLWQMLTNRMAQYQSLCAAMNIGLWRNEVMPLRRISLTTGRYIPVYEPQEFFDTRYPFEVFPTIDTYGVREQPTIDCPTVNLQGYAFQDFSYTATLDRDLTGYTVKAGVRRYIQAIVPMVWFQVEVLDVLNGVVKISLTGNLLYYVGVSKFWDMQLIDSNGNVSTVLQGTFDAVRQGLAY